MGDFAVAGTTSWGVTLAWLLAGNGHRVHLLCRSESEVRGIEETRTIPRLPGVNLPSSVSSVRFERCPTGVDGVILAVPSSTVRQNLKMFAHLASKPILSATKGIEGGTLLRTSEIVALSGWFPDAISVLSGPNLAREILAGKPAATVVAGTEGGVALWQLALHRSAFRVYGSRDRCGLEVAGALKNVVAIAVGVAAGLDAGANAIAALMTRGLAEITRLGVSLGADASTFQGLAGIGDLVATCSSPLSRNRRMGELLARGVTVEAARIQIGETVEGLDAAPVAVALGRARGVDMPVAEEVAALLEGTRTVSEAVGQLLGRPPRPESR